MEEWRTQRVWHFEDTVLWHTSRGPSSQRPYASRCCYVKLYLYLTPKSSWETRSQSLSDSKIDFFQPETKENNLCLSLSNSDRFLRQIKCGIFLFLVGPLLGKAYNYFALVNTVSSCNYAPIKGAIENILMTKKFSKKSISQNRNNVEWHSTPFQCASQNAPFIQNICGQTDRGITQP